ncbi:type III pantothenate kinase [Flavobacterium salilacus subsp. salilacus]|uniref:type III pantothenate kinase n=1 Tax=Flavobacterium TaxID=237 RepID=UPI001074D27B|nr:MULTISPECIES: type III pantothenate kinase [Flavobacterium]KAF2519976.1 type III pantothenate kinase [Flavobacterium salilacus subsp. salilacus]MBE1614111.1 type III pantothenate kinase [Flavobacterium sp. SaA2.13]NDI97801.1 type III pantothenate kinase [Flavobacterium salilacus subsp. altitudinum]
MLLAIDIGNTKIKAAVFEEHALIDRFTFDRSDAEKNIKKLFETHSGISQTILSSVAKEDAGLLSLLKNHTRLTLINHTSHFPFVNRYATPETLGIDRMVLSAGAVLLYPDTNRLVIDAGTCVTYDFTDSNNHYLGGAISPGLRLRYEAMHNFTAKLPLLYPEMPSDYIGNTTKQAMHSGTVNGLLYEIEGFISRYIEQYGNVSIILTGGDTDFLAKRLKNTIFANSNFLLESLNKLYLYTIKIEND